MTIADFLLKIQKNSPPLPHWWKIVDILSRTSHYVKLVGVRGHRLVHYRLMDPLFSLENKVLKSSTLYIFFQISVFINIWKCPPGLPQCGRWRVGDVYELRAAWSYNNRPLSAGVQLENTSSNTTSILDISHIRNVLI